MSLQAEDSAAKRATHQSMLKAKSFSIHREPASSSWAVCEIGGGPFLVPCAADIEHGSEFQLASNENKGMS